MSCKRACALLLIMTMATPVFAETPAASAPDIRLPAIVVIKAENRALTQRLIATGTIRAVEELYIQPEVEGLAIKTLQADVSDRVVAGQVLATLDDSSLLLQKNQLLANQAKAEASLAQDRIQVTDAEANAAESDRQLARGKALVGGGTISTAQVQQFETASINGKNKVASARQNVAIAEANLKAVNAQIADIDLKLARTAIRTPFAGVITARNARVGQIASGSGQPLFTVLKDGKLELVADVAEGDMVGIRVGQQALVTIAGLKDPVPGQVRLISPAVDAKTRLGSVHIALDPAKGVREGMYASATIILARATGLALPLSAIRTEDGKSLARIVRDGVVHDVPVETGIVDDGWIEVTKGLSQGDMLVEKAGAFVRDGDQVKPVPETDLASQ
ncbi:efflux RND transporter periplasmic adaptor subunit [Allorhizobium sp. BGMRC 0089]|uniref:efflux RND transporter periplasmic adaptor subunit n=1 Tax=Allorhizobium sonneratiae TaxID=2934936 RepID=UPI0020343BF9|nr:efflux RND transporter periplasmic adaptor subunit [Allorhizobium sonneratiae]MCM2291046.1 efflux RND transporter periplasmic adaptor subunit [Allorhizobium sonneratiae]